MVVNIASSSVSFCNPRCGYISFRWSLTDWQCPDLSWSVIQCVVCKPCSRADSHLVSIKYVCSIIKYQNVVKKWKCIHDIRLLICLIVIKCDTGVSLLNWPLSYEVQRFSYLINNILLKYALLRLQLRCVDFCVCLPYLI